ncbi:hypothetical protein JXQ31_15515 [candidate division KSB1 bacterium]|nr:hypothetical protein [candidate division KSB1 bacterium]
MFVTAGHAFENFKVAVYSRAYETKEMKVLNWLEPRWEKIAQQVNVDKIYLETHRDMLIVDEETISRAKKFFENRGVQTAGGITLTVNERNRFETFCYTKPEHRKKVREIVEYTAGLFDEVILDDFFFTNCKCEYCINAKGDKSWTRYRLDLMEEAARELILKPAKSVNPNVKVIIKYPNWYEHFQGLGFNLKAQPELFDGLYTGTETRDPVRSQQHLQQYQGYLIFRYFENIKPGGNKGGWVDTGGLPYMDRYAEQLWLTLFAKAPEITLFDFRQLQRPFMEMDRAEWQGNGTSFDYDEMIKPFQLQDGKTVTPITIARAAGYTLEKIDSFLGELGNPVGIKSYKPYFSTGEDFLHNFLGMVGIPMDIVPEFPDGEKLIFLTESAKCDETIVDRIKGQLMDGKNVVITSGLLRALQDKGIKDIVELEFTDRKSLVRDFVAGWNPVCSADEEVLIPQIQYLTNDSWEEISCLDNGIGWPILHSAGYGNGVLYVLTIPDNFADLYNFPPDVLSRIKQTLLENLYVRVDSPAKVALFVYDNDTFIVESFLPENVDVGIVVDSRVNELYDITSGDVLSGQEITGWGGRKTGKKSFKTMVKPHSFRVLRCK